MRERGPQAEEVVRLADDVRQRAMELRARVTTHSMHVIGAGNTEAKIAKDAHPPAARSGMMFALEEVLLDTRGALAECHNMFERLEYELGQDNQRAVRVDPGQDVAYRGLDG